MSIDLFTIWWEKESQKNLSGKRRYLHFDQKIDFSKREFFFKTFFSDRMETVGKHSFYPFIKMVIETPRYKKVESDKGKGDTQRKIVKKPRPLAYCAHFDALIYSYYSFVLTSAYVEKIKEWNIYDNVLAYIEKGKSNIEYALEVFNFVKEKSDCVALAFDITSFFDGLEHEHLKLSWCKVINERVRLPKDQFKVFNSLTNYAYVERDDLQNSFEFLNPKNNERAPNGRICEPEEFRKLVRGMGLIRKNSNVVKVEDSTQEGLPCGIPQGSPISACLSNIYMIDFDLRMKEIIESGEENGLYRRYSDDIIVIVDSSKAEKIKKSF